MNIELLFFLLGVILSSIVLYFFFSQKKEKQNDENIELSQEAQSKIESLAMDYQKKLIDQAQEDYNKKIEELQKKYNSALENYSATVQNWQQEIQSYANNFNSKKIKFENEWQNLLAERRRLLDIAEEENLARFYEEQREEQNRLIQKKESIENEVKNLTALRESIIEAQIREEKLRDEQNFYKISLTLDAQEDIEKLLRFSKECHNPQLLRKFIWSEYFLKPFGEMAGRVLGKEKVCGIYKITNLKDNKIYIGQSTDVQTRWSNHIKAALKIDSIAHSKVHDAMGEDGIQNFTFELLESCKKEMLNGREKYYIEFYKSNTYGYNLTSGGS